MQTEGTPRLRYSDQEHTDTRYYEMTNADWLGLAAFVVEFLRRGGAPMLYHSKDMAALCLSLKSGKESKKYWLGPDDNMTDLLAHAARDWGVYISPDNEIMLAAADMTQETLERLQKAGIE